ncbi:MAG: tRNA (guanosine(37)-N1)-methyltransferase TrmD [Myxococcota bacterium]
MRIELVSLFPEVEQHLRIGLLGKAIDRGLLEVVAMTPREFTSDRHRTVDDAPYGGGSGMVLMAEPVVKSLEALDERREGPTRRILLSPQGQRFDQRVAERLAGLPSLTFVCGRYEGFDERIRGHVDEELSLGDFVLLGGEVAALTMIEATVRLLPGVLGNRTSAAEESYTTGLLEYPQYTRPETFRGESVPAVLLSGHHAAIATWRRKEALRRTRERRPDLLDGAELSDEDRALLAELEAE